MSSIYIRQINLNKSPLAFDSICHVMRKSANAIYLVQEPPKLRKGQLAGLPRNYSFYGLSGSRAIIIAPKILPLFLSHELTAKDHTVCLYEVGNYKLFLCSSYLDGTYKNIISRELINMADFFADTKANAIIGLDTNAHSVAWSCETSDSRGADFEEFIVQHNFSVLNVGNKPTWRRGRLSSIIDVTLVYGDKNIVHSWHVKDKHYNTDHCMLEMTLFGKELEVPKISKVDWEKFLKCIDSIVKPISYTLWSPDIIEEEAAFFSRSYS